MKSAKRQFSELVVDVVGEILKIVHEVLTTEVDGETLPLPTTFDVRCKTVWRGNQAIVTLFLDGHEAEEVFLFGTHIPDIHPRLEDLVIRILTDYLNTRILAQKIGESHASD